MILVSQDGKTTVPFERVILDVTEVWRKAYISAIPITEDADSTKNTTLGEYKSIDDALSEMEGILTDYVLECRLHRLRRCEG